ncbi:hypothetical protein Pelo_15005 [Pelomyxa schiedti]|nr:hypothetical protein Pelo_15064 [Pelomyxa schiedti]KAH3743595.1 hypothetical protein Pelo_15005 [Pelomyxa schiedti]
MDRKRKPTGFAFYVTSIDRELYETRSRDLSQRKVFEHAVQVQRITICFPDELESISCIEMWMHAQGFELAFGSEGSSSETSPAKSPSRKRTRPDGVKKQMEKLGGRFCREHLYTRLPRTDMERNLLSPSPAYSSYYESSPKSSYQSKQDYRGFWRIGSTTQHSQTGRRVICCVEQPSIGNGNSAKDYLPLLCKSWLKVCSEFDASVDPGTVLRLSTGEPLTEDNCCLINETETGKGKLGFQGRLYLRVFVKSIDSPTSYSWVRTPMCIVTDPSLEHQSAVPMPAQVLDPFDLGTVIPQEFNSFPLGVAFTDSLEYSGLFGTYPGAIGVPSLSGELLTTTDPLGESEYQESDFTPLPLTP